MRLACGDLQGITQTTRARHLLDAVTQCGHRRNYQFNSWPRFKYQRCSLKEWLGYVLDLGRAASRQDGQNFVLILQAQLRSRGRTVRHHGNHARQGVPHVGGGNAVLREQFWLEREDAQHMIRAAADFFDSVRTPGPDGRAHEMHGFDAGSAQIGLQAQVEIGRIHADEHVGAVVEQALAQLLADAKQLTQPAQHVHAVAVYRQFVAGPPGSKAAARHLRPANAAGLQPRPMRLHAVDQQARQQVARRLARHHRDAGGICHRPALSAQCRAWRRPGTAPSSPRRRWPAARTAPALQWRRARPPA